MPGQDTERLTVTVRFLDDPCVWAWCWEIVDRRGRVLFGSWQDQWTAYPCREEALKSGLLRLADLRRASRGAAARRPSNVGGPDSVGEGGYAPLGLPRAPHTPQRTGEGEGRRAPARLVIVARDEEALWESLKAAFADSDRIAVIRDRRYGERRRRDEPVAVERRRGERRRRPALDAEVRSRGWAVVSLAEPGASTALTA